MERIFKLMKTNKKKYINHVAIVIDDSGSMRHLVNKTREVVNAQIDNFAKADRVSGQETRLSIYIFGTKTKCICFDEALHKVPNARDYIHASSGDTALIDATLTAIDDLKGISTRSGDHAFLVYAHTDGQENRSVNGAGDLQKVLRRLNEDWTVAAFVPSEFNKSQVVSWGFSSDNVEVWSVSERGMEDVGTKFAQTYSSYQTMRCSGLKSTKSLFKFDDSLKKSHVTKVLDEVDPGQYETLLVRKYDDGKAIKDFVESWTKRPYRTGSAYYQVTKPEIIQGSKSVAVVEKATGKMYSGAPARGLLGLPSYDVKVAPAEFSGFDLFVQSTSTNRKLVKDTHLIVFE